MLASKTLFTLSVLAIAYPSALAYTWPDPTDLLESIYYEQVGFNSRAFGSFVRTCANGGNLGGGRTNTAEWIRTAYHDMATADVEAGTGGIDASIGFEKDRPENAGRAFFDTLLFFENFISIRSSMADLIALGAVMSVTSCTISPDRKPVILDFKGGRIDATGPSPPGVPEPHQDLATHTASFKKQGFNATEMIALVACGHSLGGVNGREFPEIVPVLNTSENIDSKQNFDGTQAALDNTIAIEFLKNSTQNALAFGHNETTRSDFRVFNSDGGAMIRKLASSQDYFLETCAPLLQRMIDTVPRGVKLSEPITPIEVKPDDVDISVDESGNMTISAHIRIRTDNRPIPVQRQVLVHLKPRKSDWAVVQIVETTKLERNTTGFFPNSPSFEWWNLTASVPATQMYASFLVEVIDDSTSTTYSNGGGGFPLETDIIPQSMQSCGYSSMITGYNLNVTVAVRDDARFKEVKLTAQIPMEQEGSMVRKHVPHEVVMQKTRSLTGTGYSLYNASLVVNPKNKFVTILSYGLSGRGGLKDVDVPFIRWNQRGCHFSDE